MPVENWWYQAGIHTIALMARTRRATAGSTRLHRSIDVPQADRLPNVRRLVAAAREGIHNASALLELLDVDERHFAYYRSAAEILGVIAVSGGGHLALTDRGRDLLATREGGDDERTVLRDAILSARALKPFSSFFKGEKLSVAEIADRLCVLTPLSRATAERRAKTLVQWRKFITPPPAAPGPSLPIVAAQVEGLVASHNALAKQKFLEWLVTMPPAEFEAMVARLATAMGHVDVQTTGRSGDGGVDVESTRVDDWGTSRRVLMQVKRYSAPVGRKFVDEFLGVMTRRRCAEGILVTCSDFTAQAQEAAGEAQQLTLVNGAQLVQLLAKHRVRLILGKYGEILSADAS